MNRLSSACAVVVLALVAGVLPASATSDSADAPHVHVRLVVVPDSLTAGGDAKAGLSFKLAEGWHVYWQNAGDAGEPPHMHWTLPNGVTAGALQFPAPQRLPLGPLMDFGYENEVLFPFTLHVAKTARTGPAVLHTKVDWLVCRATCIPGKAELELTRNISTQQPTESASDAALYDRFAARLPQGLPSSDRVVFTPAGAGFALQITTGQRESEAAFFPSDQEILDNPASQSLTPTADGALLLLKKDAGLSATPATLNGVLELAGGRSFVLAAQPGSIDATLLRRAIASASQEVPSQGREQGKGSERSLGEIALLAFVGGILLNLMPCVFPVLFLKGLALVRSGNEERRTLRRHGFVYTAGIVVSFWALVGVLLGLRSAGSVLGWGFQFQSPVFLELLAALLFFLGLSLAGQFELGLSLTSAGGALAAKQGYAGSFFTGVLAVIVATPCTGPFMAAAIGYALAQPAAVTFAVFTALALGLAAPYVALTLQPAWTRWLPRPGAWMDILKQATAVPIFATVIWLAWVLAQAYGAALLAVLLACFLVLAIAGWFLGRWQGKRWAGVVAALLLLVVVLAGFYAPQKLISESTPAAQPATGRGWQPWSSEAVSQYQAQGRPVFVDFTASWCLSCQVNERIALDQPEVKQGFAQANVVLLRADWTRRDESITQALTALGRDGVPAYVLYRPGQSTPILLPQVLTSGIILDALKDLPRTSGQQPN